LTPYLKIGGCTAFLLMTIVPYILCISAMLYAYRKVVSMRRYIVVFMVLVLIMSLTGFAWAGGRHRGYHGHYHGHSGNNSALWWGLGAGVGLGMLGALAVRPYYQAPQPYSAYPPMVIQPAPIVVHLWCPAYQAYYPYVPSCPGGWLRVQVP
jgi:hypothetical protein